MTDFFSQNMAALKRHYPLLAEELEKTSGAADSDGGADNAGAASEGEIKVEAAASGAPTLVFRGVYAHSRRDPEREAERLVESALAADPGGAAPALVLGFGLGYAACALAAKAGERPVIVVEKNPAFLKKALEVRDLRPFFSRGSLAFALGGSGEAVTGALSLFESSPGAFPLVLQNRALTAGDREWYAAVEERISAWNSRANVNRATRRRFGKRWVRNLSRNLAAVRDIPGISRLEGMLAQSDIPVFLAAAGPTLDAAGHALGEISKRCVVVAVDTSLRFLLSRGIDPDFAVSVDPQYWNFRHLDRVPAPNTRLVAESAVYPPCLRHAFGGVFLCGSFFPLGRFIEDRVDKKGELGAGGSVATSAWDFIRILGARTVWIAGLDLSFPELKTHFKGAAFEEKSHAESGRFAPAETWNFKALRDGQPFLAKRKGGGSVLTDKRLSLYAGWFENRFGQFPGIKNFCLSPEGFDIKGLEAAPLEKLLALPERRKEIDSLLGEIFSAVERDFNSGEAKTRRSEQYDRAERAMLADLGTIKNLAEDAARNAAKAASRNRQGRLEKDEQERALKKLDAANKSIAESGVKEIAGFLFPETENWEAEIAAKEKTPLARHLEFSVRFYAALAEAADCNLRVLGSV